MITIVGYMASMLIAISLLVGNQLRSRLFNAVGCMCFIAYGIAIEASPVILTNSILLVINLFLAFRQIKAKGI